MLLEDQKKLPKEFPFEIQHYHENKKFFESQETLHWHRFFEITYVEDGCAQYYVNGKIYTVQAGDIILFNHVEAHKWKILSDDMDLIVLTFLPDLISDGSRVLEVDYLLPFLERDNNFKNRIPGAEKCTETVKLLMDEIMEESRENKTGARLMIKADILKLLTVLVRYYEKGKAEETSEFLSRKKESLHRIELAFDFIRENYDRKITLEETASTVCMSPNYFSGYFKKSAGCSFQEYLLKTRMEKARERLLYSTDSILEIAQECGISNTANFYRLFKKYYGVAPGEERRRESVKPLLYFEQNNFNNYDQNTDDTYDNVAIM